MLRLQALLWLVVLSAVCGKEVSRQAPKIYHQFLESRLTPLDEVRNEKHPHGTEEERGVVLLSETIAYVKPNGLKVRATHVAYLALTEQGAKDISRERFAFYSDRQKIHLIAAQTIDPDGKVAKVPEEGIFVQKSNGDDGSRIYDDREDLVLVYPNVKVGSIVEAIVVREDTVTNTENEFEWVTTWAPGWPVVKKQRLIGMPPAMAKRVKVIPVGKGSPKAVITEEDGLHWYRFVQKQASGGSYERNRPPSSQIGPATWLTTFESWEKVSSWYDQLVSKSSELDEALKKLSADRVEGASDKMEIARRLFGMVANEVRYTGLEFGVSAMKPYDCNLVWKRKFGDCKDKSTLLVSLLRAQGIEAWVGLVNTEDAGVVHRKAPGSRSFDHAIVVVDVDFGDGEKLVFCDPTIRHGHLGVISPSVADRPVLLVKEKGGRLVKSPKSGAGSYDYRFDLEMDQEGRLSGWLTWKTSGYYAAGIVSRYEGLDRESAVRRMKDFVGRFFENASVIDVEIPEIEEGSSKEFEIRAYLTTPVNVPDERGRITMPFPSMESLYMNYGSGDERKADMYQWPDKIYFSARIDLGEGIVPDELPGDSSHQSDGLKSQLGWRFRNGKLEAKAQIECLGSVLEAKEVLAARRIVSAVDRWLENPVKLVRGKSWRPGKQEESVNLPVMPTGRGQLDLVNERFPVEGNLEQRRKALQKVIALFPKDQETVYLVKSEMAYTFYYEDQTLRAISEYTPLVSAKPGRVNNQTYAFVLYMMANCQMEMEAHGEAIATFGRVLDLNGVSNFRVAWTKAMLGNIYLRQKRFQKSQEQLEAALLLDQDVQGFAWARLLEAYVNEGRSRMALERWQDFYENDPESGEAVLRSFLKNADFQEGAYANFYELLEAVLEGELKQEIALLRSRSKYEKEKDDIVRELGAKLIALIDEDTPEYFDGGLTDELETREQFEEALAELFAKDDVRWLAYFRTYLERFEADDQFTENLWSLSVFIEFLEEPGKPFAETKFMERLIPLLNSIPREDDNHWESQFVIAEWHQERNEWEKARAVFERMLEDPIFPDDFAQSCYWRRGIVLENLGKWEEAIECHLKYKEKRKDDLKACMMVWRAGLISLRLGKYDQALNTWGLLEDVPEDLYAEAPFKVLLYEAVKLVGKPDLAKKYWQDSEKWWNEDFRKFVELTGQEWDPSPCLLDLERNQECEALLATNDAAEVLKATQRIAFNARWFPSRFFQFYMRNVEPLSKLDGDWLDPFRILTYKLTRIAPRIDTGIFELSQRLRVGLLYDSEGEDSLEEARALYQVAKDRDGVHGDYAAYIYAASVCRYGDDLDQAEEMLEKLWRKESLGIKRTTVANAMIEVATARKNPENLEQLLGRLLEHPSIKSEKALFEKLTKQKDTLKKTLGGQKELLATIEKIHAEVEMSWLPHVEPKELSDDADWLAKDSEHALETYRKRYLLVKRGGLLSREELNISLEMIRFHLERAVFHDDAFKIWDQFLYNDRLSKDLRISLLWYAFEDATKDFPHLERAEKLRKHKLWDQIRDEITEVRAPLFLLAANAWNEEPKAVLAEIGKVTKGSQIGSDEIEAIMESYLALKVRGEEEAMKELEDLVGDMKLAEGSQVSAKVMKLRMRRIGRKINGMVSFFEGLYRALLPEIEANPADPDVKVSRYRNFENLGDLSVNARRAVRLTALRENLNGIRYEPTIWRPIIGGGGPGEIPLSPGVFAGFLKAIKEYEENEMAMAAMMSMVEALFVLDDEDERNKRVKELKDWSESLENGDFKLLTKLCASLLTDGTVDKAQLSRYSRAALEMTDGIGSLHRVVATRLFLKANDRKCLKKHLENVPEEEWFNWKFFLTNYLALKAADMTDEAELLLEEAPDFLKSSWMTSWHEEEAGPFFHAVTIAAKIDQIDADDAPWFEGIPSAMSTDKKQREARLIQAYSKKDWNLLERLASAKETQGIKEIRFFQLVADFHLKKEGVREKIEKEAGSGSPFSDTNLILESLLRKK